MPPSALNHIVKLGLSKKTIIVRDKGQFVHIALSLAQDYKRVIYSSAVKEPYGNPITSMVGEGLDGVETTKDFFESKKEADTVIFVDEGEMGLQKELRSQGIPTFGCAGADILEQDRWEFKKVLKQRGLEVEPFETCTGIDELTEHLRSHDKEELYVKVNNDARGMMETRKHISFRLSQSTIDEWAYKLGPCRSTQRFMVCKPIKGQEPGSDHYFTAGNYLSPAILGFEGKDAIYLGKVMEMDDFPNSMKSILDAMRPVFAKHDVRGAISTEMRGEKKLTFTDFCARFGFPPSGVSVEGLLNFSEIVDRVARGEAVTPQFRAKYLAEIMVSSPCAENTTVDLDIKDKNLKTLKIPYLCKIDGVYRRLMMPNSGTNIAEALGWGDSAIEAEQMAVESAASMKANGACYDADEFDEIEKSIKQFSKHSGMEF